MKGWLKRFIRRISPMSPAERREAHKRVLLSSAGGVSMATNENGHIDLREESSEDKNGG